MMGDIDIQRHQYHQSELSGGKIVLYPTHKHLLAVMLSVDYQPTIIVFPSRNLHSTDSTNPEVKFTLEREGEGRDKNRKMGIGYDYDYSGLTKLYEVNLRSGYCLVLLQFPKFQKAITITVMKH